MTGLCLRRRQGESIMIGDSITVTVSDIRGGQVLLTVQAPAEVRVDREEIYERRAREVAGGASGCK